MYRKIHRWVGLVLALPLLLQALTGCLLVLIPLLTSGRPHVATGRSPLAVATQIEAATSYAPKGTIALHYAFARWDGDSAVVSFGKAGERHPPYQVMVNPADAHVTGTHRIPAVFFFLHRLHEDLFLVPYGNTATALMGVLLLAMAITGVVIWWPRPDLWISGKWRKTIVVSRRARGTRLWRELHVSVGFWLSLMMGFMAFSGAIMAFPQSRVWFGVQGGGRPAVMHGHGGHRGSMGDAIDPDTISIDETISRIRTALPGAIITDLQLGENPSSLSVQTVLPGIGPNHPATVKLARDHATIVMQRNPRTTKVGEQFFGWMHTLHEGKLTAPSWFASLWLFLVFLSGAALLLFTITGVVIWWSRRSSSQKYKAASARNVVEAG